MLIQIKYLKGPRLQIAAVPESDLSLCGKSFRIAELVGRVGSRSFSRTALAGRNDVR
jgi:hypothetical protein